MIKINGKEYKINMDMKWGTQKLLQKIRDDPLNKKNMKYLELIIKDILVPTPSQNEMFNFRNSDIETIFTEFGKDSSEVNKDFKKKLSQ